MGEPLLIRVRIERQENGRWELHRDRPENGDRFICDDLNDAFRTVLAAYNPDGTPRAMAVGKTSACVICQLETKHPPYCVECDMSGRARQHLTRASVTSNSGDKP